MAASYILRLLLLGFLVKVQGDVESEFQNDRGQSGNYVFFLCGSGIAGSQAAKLQTLLPKTWQNLQNILTDVELGTASLHGYRSFLKTNDNKENVRSVFLAIAEGRLIERNSGQAIDSVINPTFICANPTAQGTASRQWYSNHCDDDRTFALTHHTAVSYETGTNIIVICPAFWNLPTVLTPDWCPDVVGPRRRKRFAVNNDILTRSQFAALTHDLVHLYSPFEEDGWDEKYRIQDLVDLNATDSLKNAQNWAAYASAVQVGCDQFPLSPTRREDELRL